MSNREIKRYLKKRGWVEESPGVWVVDHWCKGMFKRLSINDAYDMARHYDKNCKFTLPLDNGPWV